MKGTLGIILLTLSGCFSTQNRCPDENELRNSGFYLYSIARQAGSKKEDERRVAKFIFEDGCKYFKCTHQRQHAYEALKYTFEEFNLSKEERKQMIEDLNKIEN